MEMGIEYDELVFIYVTVHSVSDIFVSDYSFVTLSRLCETFTFTRLV